MGRWRFDVKTEAMAASRAFAAPSKAVEIALSVVFELVSVAVARLSELFDE